MRSNPTPNRYDFIIRKLIREGKVYENSFAQLG